MWVNSNYLSSICCTTAKLLFKRQFVRSWCFKHRLHLSGKPLKLPLRSGVLLGLDLAEDFVGEIVLEASAYAVDLDGRERATSRWKKKALRIQACSFTG